ncbi:ParB/RepB/Spo0J family partition protein [Arthrobacter sp. SDTb3-6]|uniref:ParB/RepB/Spo0J family partition protein n=1 Tax=Arthrobacter sp. SDTb3-6 TaxID=2713571 RepID=UPI00159D11C1|nr:ParB/RepB/Spo0J family partition protein [Arthrobacter sp. SDTb3-6]
MTVYEVVDIARVRANPSNIREDLGDLERLTAEVKTIGVLQPLIVYPHPSLEGDFVIKDGHRRRQAAVNAGLLKVPVLIEEVSVRGALDDIETMLTTGRNHRPLDLLEEAKGFQMLLDLGLNESTIGKRFKKPKSEIVTKSRLVSAPEKVQDAFARGRVDLLQLKKLTDLQAAGQTEVLERALDNREFNTSSGYGIDVERVIAQAETAVQAEATTERLLALGAKEITQEQSYKLTRVPDEPALTEEEHVAAEHFFFQSPYRDETDWYLKTSKQADSAVSDAVKAERATLRELSAGLLTAFKLRRQFMVRTIQDTGAGVSLEADLELLLDCLIYPIMKLDVEVLAQITGIEPPEDKESYRAREQWQGKVRASFARMSWKQIARAAAWGDSQDTDKRLRKAPAFDRTEYNWSHHKSWLDKLQRLFGYRLDEAERDTLEFFKAKGGKYGYGELTEGTNRDVNDDVEILN